MTSAYPTPVDKLTEQIRALASEQGVWPSLRQIKMRCNVGHPKAVDALAALRATGFDPANPDRQTTPDQTQDSQTQDSETAPVPVAERRLHAVPPAHDPAEQENQADDHEPVANTATNSSATVDTQPVTVPPEPVPARAESVTVASPVADVADPVSTVAEPPVPASTRMASRWRNLPVYLIALGAFVAIWGGWVGLGQLTGFGPVNLLPGIGDGWTINTAITLPLGMEAYAAYAMRVWFDKSMPARARRFAMWSTCGALLLGMSGQVAYHLMQAAGVVAAPWQITTFVSCLPVLVLGGAAALVHLSHDTSEVQR
ncbi:hypothetical protein ALI144C_02880 [Actinosynnema sp. ALI-1.44]|uniref:hypothetical protein n=1 Tax=Actinosynnema sp. ALI-1.44 TaxID=1933779 RepID=UPI00097C6C71|nr:hypothetical protein [Actinosynnema sp. ALI-1.44]ONI90632.1 hypothetical protein ALI144C_02880 [Actinosynnema sp. ALI-1.44]